MAQLEGSSRQLVSAWGTWLVEYPAVFVIACTLPLLWVAWAFRLHPTPLVLKWFLWICLLSVAAATTGGVSIAAMIAAVLMTVWLVADWFPRVTPDSRRWLYRAGWGLLIAALVPWCAQVAGVLALDALGLTLLVIDVLTLPRRRSLQVNRQTLKIVSLQKRHPVEMQLINRSRRTLRLEFKDDLPQEIEASPREFDIRLRPRQKMTFGYELKATRRGEYLMSGVHLRYRSWLGLWTRYVQEPLPQVLHVYPDMKQLSEYAYLARNNRLSLMGVKRTRRVGQDNEFERLRDYALDDNFRHIDWRATARRNKLTVRDFQVNQSQRLMFLIDCGRMMTNQANGIDLLDHAINAMLMASYVALQQGDSVGLVCFSDRILNYVPPRGGMRQMNQLLHAVFNRHPQLVESRYDEAFLHLRTHCRKRSLVVMVSNLIDEVNARQVEQYLATLVGRHLPLGVLLRDHSLFRAADQRPTRPLEAFTAAAAAEILSWRHQLLVDLSHRGVLALDVFPEDMTAPLVNSYLQIKARHLL